MGKLKYKEIRYNLFSLDDKYFLAHCISADARMGAGIALEFTKKKHEVKQLRNQQLEVGRTYLTKKVFNLVSKKVYHGKPSYETISLCIQDLAQQCVDNNVLYLGLPKIGCGLDRLSWPMVKETIIHNFENTDIHIVVCTL